jgi:hypothetical protein
VASFQSGIASKTIIPRTTSCSIQSTKYWDDAQGGSGCDFKALYKNGQNSTAGPRTYYSANQNYYDNNGVACEGENHIHNWTSCWEVENNDFVYESQQEAIDSVHASFGWGIAIGVVLILFIALCCCLLLSEMSKDCDNSSAQDYRLVQ